MPPARTESVQQLPLDPQPTTLAVAVYDRLLRDIRSGELVPGSPLRTEWLKARYGAGVSPLREALARLAAEHMVTAEGKRGFRVASISLEDFEQLVVLRKDLEAKAILSSFEHGTDDWEGRVVAALHKLSKTQPPGAYATQREAEERERRHRAFHHELIGACNSRWLLRVCTQLTAHLERYRRIILRPKRLSEATVREIAWEHSALMEAALGRRAQEAVALLERHRHRTYDAIIESFEGWQSPAVK